MKDIPGLEIMGQAGSLELEEYAFQTGDSLMPECPLRALAADFTGATLATDCKQTACAWWNGEKGHCGLIR